MSGLSYAISLQTIHSGFDGKTCWVHARAGAIPGAGRQGGPAVVLTMQKLLLTGSDIFYCLHDMRTDDLGGSWSPPAPMPALDRYAEEGGIVVCPCDFYPAYHAASGKLLGIGHEARYAGDRLVKAPRRCRTVYSVHDAASRTWGPVQALVMPDDRERFFSAGAGCAQRVELADGTILLPVYFHSKSAAMTGAPYSATVARCRFDGRRLSYLEHGDELTIAEKRGLCEPSLTRFQGRYFITLRNDLRGYVAAGSDGLHFGAPRPWTFDDGSDLGNYNTQQHWLTHGEALHLVYTRRGADNDHVLRHRAPLFAAQVDVDRLCVLRATERILIPQRGARLGNFGVTRVSEKESWVTVCEWMQPVGCEKYGSDNSVYVARVAWDRPNAEN